MPTRAWQPLILVRGWGGSGEAAEAVAVTEGAACVTRALSPSVAGARSEETMCESVQESLPGSGCWILCLSSLVLLIFGLES